MIHKGKSVSLYFAFLSNDEKKKIWQGDCQKCIYPNYRYQRDIIVSCFVIITMLVWGSGDGWEGS